MKNFMRIMAVAGVAFVWSAELSAQGARYIVTGITATDLGTLGGGQSRAHDINSVGTVVGWAETTAGIRHAAIFEPGMVIDLGATLGDTPSEAWGINNSRAVVGHVEFENGPNAFRWRSGLLTLLNHDTGSTGQLGSYARAISDTGRIAGKIFLTEFGDDEAAVWTTPDFFHLIDGGDYLQSSADDINSDSQVVGYESARDTGVRWSFSRTGSTRTRLPLPFPRPWLTDDRPLGINNSGAIVGWAVLPGGGGPHATYWDGTSALSTDLGLLPTGRASVADDVNNNNFVAGYADKLVRIGGGLVTVRVESGFIHHPDIGMRELPRPASSSSLNACRATALNDLRNGTRIQVVGYCYTATGMRAVRWDVTVLLIIPI